MIQVDHISDRVRENAVAVQREGVLVQLDSAPSSLANLAIVEGESHLHHQVHTANEGRVRVVFGMHGISSWCVRLSALQFESRLSQQTHAGNSVKAGVRFVSYDHFKHALADAEVSDILRSMTLWKRENLMCRCG